jgi:lysophospholipid acyltransferase (LPLAT)-like uncharacterized protein
MIPNILPPAKKYFAKFFTFCIRLWTRSLHIHIPTPCLNLLNQYLYTPKICAFWHNRLFIASELFLRYFKDITIYGLISPSKDGAWLAEIYRNIGICSIRGSSRRGGKEAFEEMATILNSGATIAITPDGPRGPRYCVKPGIAALAKETNIPILLGGIHIPHAWRCRSWDRFYIPKPFSHVTVQVQVITPESYASLSQQQLLKHIQTTLYKMNTKY